MRLLGIVWILIMSVLNTCSGEKKIESQFEVDINNIDVSKFKKINIKELKTKFPVNVWEIATKSNLMTLNITFKNEGCRSFYKQPGLLDLVLDTILEGAGNRSGVELKKELEDRSIDIAIKSGADDIIIRVSFLAKYFDFVTDILSDILSKATFPEDKIEMNRQAIIMTLTQSKFDPQCVASEKLNNMIRISPYRTRIDDTLKSIKKYTKVDIKNCYRKLFDPGNAVITVVNNLHFDHLTTGINKIYDAIKDKKNDFQSGTQTTTLEKSEKVAHMELDNPQSTVLFALPGVLRNDKDKIAIRAASQIFGGGNFDTRLIKSVRVKKGLVYFIYNTFSNNDLQSVLIGTAKTQPENTSKVIEEVKAQCKQLYNDGITEEEFNEFKISKISSHVFKDTGEVLNFVVSRRNDGIELNKINDLLDEYLSLNLDDINRALKKVYNPDNLVFVSCGKTVDSSDKVEQIAKPKQTVVKINNEQEQKIKTNEKVEEINDKIDVQEEILNNGLRVVVVPMTSTESVFFGVGYCVGDSDDPRNTVGISHFLEHIMFMQSKNLGKGEIDKCLCRYNKSFNGWTTDDFTFYPHECNKAFLDVNVKLEAERMSNLVFDEEEIESEKNVIIEERKMRVESHPRFRFASEAVLKALYLYSNYSYPGIGYIDQIKACNKKNIEEHYKKYYIPNNAFAIFVGNINKEEAVTLCRKYFGSIKKGSEIKRRQVHDPLNTGLTHKIQHVSNQLTSSFLDIYYKIPRSDLDSLKKEYCLNIGLNILCKGMSSILYKDLVDDKQLAHDVGLEFGEFEKKLYDASPLSIAIQLKEGVKFETVENRINEIINKFTAELLTEDLFNQEKTKIKDSIEILKDRPEELEVVVLLGIISGYPIEDISNIKNIVDSIKIDDVKNAMRKAFMNKAVVLYSMPEHKK